MSWMFGTRQSSTAHNMPPHGPMCGVGIVRSYNEDQSVAVQSGATWYSHAFVLPQRWVTVSREHATAELDKPPLESPVFFLIDEQGNAFVLCGWPTMGDQTIRDLAKENTDEQRVSIAGGSWKRIFKRKTGSLQITDESEGGKARLSIDKENGEIHITDFNGHTFDADSGGWNINGDDHGGLPSWKALEPELNKINAFIDTFKQMLEIPVNEAGNGAPSAFQQAFKAAFSSYQNPDYSSVESQKTRHGSGD